MRRIVNRRNRKGRDESGFTLIELTMVIILMAIIFTVVVVLYFQATRDSAVRATQEMLKTDLRKVYSLTDAGVSSNNNGVRDRYRITMHDNNAPDASKNCWRIEKGVCTDPNTLSFSWTDYDVASGEANQLIPASGHKWIKPSGETDISLVLPASTYTLTFVSQGTVLKVSEIWGSGDMTLQVKSANKNAGRNVVITPYGEVSS